MRDLLLLATAHVVLIAAITVVAGWLAIRATRGGDRLGRDPLYRGRHWGAL